MKLILRNRKSYYEFLAYIYDLSKEDVNKLVVLREILDYPLAFNTTEVILTPTITKNHKLLLRKELNLKVTQLENWFSKLRKKNVIKNNTLSKVFYEQIEFIISPQFEDGEQDSERAGV